MPVREAVFAIYEGLNTPYHPSVSRAVRTKDYKLIRNFLPCRKHQLPIDMGEPVQKQNCPVIQLFDLKQDLDESDDVAENPQYAAIRSKLDRLLLDWLVQVKDPFGRLLRRN